MKCLYSIKLNLVLIATGYFMLFSCMPSSCEASKKYNRYLAHIFNKYGSGGTMSFEGLEHLMHSLGLGGLEFNPTHTIEEHHPDGYKIPDLTLDNDDLSYDDDDDNNNNNNNNDHKNGDNDPKYAKDSSFSENISGQATKVKELKETNKNQNNNSGNNNNNVKITNKTKTEQNLNNLSESKNYDNHHNNNDDSNNNNNNNDNYDNNDDDNLNILSAEDGINNKTHFKEMHDPKHRHPRHHVDPESGSKCLSPKSLMKLIIDFDDIINDKEFVDNNNYESFDQNQSKRSKRYATAIGAAAAVTGGASGNHGDITTKSNENDEEKYTIFLSSMKITPIIFMKMCPALLAQIDQDACVQPLFSASKTNINREAYGYAWIYASIAIFIISCCGLFGVAIIPLAKSIAYDEILKFLVAIAIGTLCGDALMHLLPHALIEDHDQQPTSSIEQNSETTHKNEPILLCSCTFLTVLFMYALETLLPLIRGKNSGDHHHHHHHDHSQQHKHSTTQNRNDFDPTADNFDMEIASTIKNQSKDLKELNMMLDENKLDKKDIELSPIAFMVILGDSLHNVTDGLAIGAAFAGDPVTGIATAFAILCHELPHELGDFALLLQTGVSIKRAIFFNILSSILSFIGMAAGLILAGIESYIIKWIYAGTAGSFLYIALSDLIPEMNRNNGGGGEEGDRNRNLRNCFIQIIGIFLGGAIMLIIALNEDSIRLLFDK